ncbi:TetR/AcrR family transcriptional regulator [Paenibacillus elgii]|uniref:TetR/AcrR family transcriptional regulator n=1 Tax=Paenibacillus elgii TaxID=189691 RepID=UPI000FDA3D00|nr:TetR/AcrR family transcriptional regulator [Paenibacillus elgii]NEN81764.1 TetR/AcrR family transcriptional regulator [Paenibacillus elgii]
MARITKDPEVRRNELLDAAVQLFGDKGVERTSVSDIVKQVGVAQGTFYYYFKTKDDVIFALIERTLSEQMEYVNSVAGQPGIAADRKLVAALLERPAVLPNYRDFLQVLHHESNAMIHQRFVSGKISAMVQPIAHILEQGVKEGVFQVAHPAETAEFMLTAILFMFDPGFFDRTEEEIRAKADAIVGIMGKLLGADLPPPDQTRSLLAL